MNSLLKLTIATTTLALVASCAQQPTRDRASTFYQVPVGSSVVLHNPLEIKPGHARQFVQRGVVTDHSDLDQYLPSCSFEVRNLKQEPQQIQPDSFAVVRVQLGESQIVAVPFVQVAARNIGQQRLGLSSWDGGEPLVAKFYHLWVSSSQQPNVMRITCFGAMADLSESERPTFMEIEAALGTVATIRP